MNNDLISRKEVIKYLKNEQEKLIAGFKKDSVIPTDARNGALLSTKAMINFISQLPSAEDREII